MMMMMMMLWNNRIKHAQNKSKILVPFYATAAYMHIRLHKHYKRVSTSLNLFSHINIIKKSSCSKFYSQSAPASLSMGTKERLR